MQLSLWIVQLFFNFQNTGKKLSQLSRKATSSCDINFLKNGCLNAARPRTPNSEVPKFYSHYTGLVSRTKGRKGDRVLRESEREREGEKESERRKRNRNMRENERTKRTSFVTNGFVKRAAKTSLPAHVLANGWTSSSHTTIPQRIEPNPGPSGSICHTIILVNQYSVCCRFGGWIYLKCSTLKYINQWSRSFYYGQCDYCKFNPSDTLNKQQAIPTTN